MGVSVFTLSRIRRHQKITLTITALSQSLSICFKILFPGDIETAAWRSLLQNQRLISALNGVDILIASHHGRESGYFGDIFQYFTRNSTVISDGRFIDTSATSRYSEKSEGWTIRHRDNSKPSEEKKCVTTRNDGHIDIEIGKMIMVEQIFWYCRLRTMASDFR